VSTLFGFFESPWARALLALTLSAMFAVLVDRYILRGLAYLSRKTHTELDDRILRVLKGPLVVSTVLIGFATAITHLQWGGNLRFISMALIETVALVVWTRAVFLGASGVMRLMARRPGVSALLQKQTLPLFDIMAKLLIAAAGLYFGFLAWRIDVTAWMASAGVIGLAVGFAAKDTLANLFAGIFILADAPYKLGDTIVLDGQTRGVVTQVGIRSTRVLTRDAVEITVPNALIANGMITNESGGPGPKTRLRIPVTVAYGSRVDAVRDALLSCVEGVANVANSPEPQVLFMEMGDSALVFHLVVWIHEPAMRDDACDILNTRIYDTLNTRGIEIPFPQTDLHVRTMQSPAAE
jgi:small-conductance mechanosensitive channel